MQIDIGCFYFIKDIFFDVVNDPELMKNKENGIKRPCYFCFKSKENDKIIWFIPVSTKIQKYQKIYNEKIQKQIKLGKTPSIDTIVFGYVANTYSTFLIQNMFPVKEEYIESQYIKNKVAIKLSNKLQTEIINKANKVLNLYNHGMKNIIFPDVDGILKKLMKMEKFYFEKPSMKRKEEIIEYLDEFVEYNSDINGTGSLDKIYDGYTYEEALERCLNMENKEYAESVGRCQGKTLLLIRENDNKIVGTINIRWNLNKEMLRFGGHIGYGVRPTERRKGYNKINLYLGLIEAKKVGLDNVMLDCAVKNLGSNKTIQALGGVLERCEKDPNDEELTNVYWIDINESLKKYKKIYEQFI